MSILGESLSRISGRRVVYLMFIIRMRNYYNNIIYKLTIARFYIPYVQDNNDIMFNDNNHYNVCDP